MTPTMTPAAGPQALATALTQPPTLQLSFYDFGVVLRRHMANGACVEYPVDPSHVAHALAAKTQFCTGLLPPDTLYVWQAGLTRLVVGYRPPQRTALFLEGAETPLRIPLPGMVMVRLVRGERDARYGVFAVTTRPTTLDTPLYHAPLPNVYGVGSVCWGSVPHATDLTNADLGEAWGRLLGTVFTAHSVSGKSQRYGQDIRQHYLALERRRARVYPVRDLVPLRDALTLGMVIQRSMKENES